MKSILERVFEGESPTNRRQWVSATAQFHRHLKGFPELQYQVDKSVALKSIGQVLALEVAFARLKKSAQDLNLSALVNEDWDAAADLMAVLRGFGDTYCIAFKQAGFDVQLQRLLADAGLIDPREELLEE